ncbi:helix-turn-helix transcriptional regulator [Salmonella enterica subsp. enterica serovar Give]|uniref:Helix-turn-helix transcriptional regulator n=1 Tax=Salmonella enterica subsp. enterica serovar Give TaxID=46626 RepID=A0A8E7KD08_SALET|nr:helix-turn-helix transcriptional regulator [Salmonella enterica]EBU8924847.1 LuxR family transcriptional regulator [Salmonella enterica subsp. enterica serovar Nima]EBW2289729.1 LuxR family transcriptional regulator [Salmonella enterica subsp. enterica serovar Newport]EDS7029661.1 helix-turn-helix transcriptional regulator [Salmonella enterica subsp. enterica]EEP8237721.1 helix-turn-helix transcriptional regulator [Salmonella enterica subsp. enterica serovar Chester]EIR7526203.1 helix-turn-
MTANPANIPESKKPDRIWYGNLCIKFNSDGGLTPAELRIIRLLLEGYKSGQIATRNFRSIKTISAQKGKAFKRLGVRNDATLLQTLLLRGIVSVYTGRNQFHKTTLSEAGLS